MENTHNSPDGLNPEFLFNLTHSQLLVKIVSGAIDPVQLAAQALANRGLDPTGQWVGLEVANKIFKMNQTK